MERSNPTAFKRFAERWLPKVEAALENHSELDQAAPHLREAVRYALLAPGKRLRPLLVLAGTHVCDGDPALALPASSAVEMIHAYSLVHDDLPAMDDDDLRRGRPTCHKVYGEAMAILAGDGLLALAFETLTQLSIPAETLVRATAELAHAAGACQLVGGQADDIDGAAGGETLERLHAIHRRKTGAMIRVALRLGGMVAGAADEKLDALDRYGDRLGLAFQITDDLLDVQGKEAAMGKRLGKDLEHGKLTFPGLLGIEASTKAAREAVDEACATLDCFEEPATGVLRCLAQFVLERKN